jgi:AraC-like DNA-binding protein
LAGFAAHAPAAGVPELVSLGEQWAPTQFEIAAHAHRTWELYLQIDGRSAWHSDRASHELGPGIGYIVPPGVVHQLRVKPTGAHHFYYAEIDVAGVLRRQRELRSAWRSSRRFHVLPAQSLHDPFKQLVHQVTLEAAHRDLAIRLALDELIVAATRLLSSSATRHLVVRHPSVVRACHLIEREPGADWTLQRLARASGSSASHLAALFQRELGQPPHRYLLRHRIEVARARLRDTDVSVTQLSGELGFSSSQHFAKMFRKYVGASARTWRTRSRRTAPQN